MYRIQIFNRQRDLSIQASSAKVIVKEILEEHAVKTDEVIVHFVTKRKICKLHQTFFNDPTSTDCISFPIDPPTDIKLGYHVLGEVFVCPRVAMEYCDQKALKDPYPEVSLYLVHGILHLLGFDDQTTQEKRLMRASEKKLINLLISKNLLLKS